MNIPWIKPSPVFVEPPPTIGRLRYYNTSSGHLFEVEVIATRERWAWVAVHRFWTGERWSTACMGANVMHTIVAKAMRDYPFEETGHVPAVATHC